MTAPTSGATSTTPASSPDAVEGGAPLSQYVTHSTFRATGYLAERRHMDDAAFGAIVAMGGIVSDWYSGVTDVEREQRHAAIVIDRIEYIAYESRPSGRLSWQQRAEIAEAKLAALEAAKCPDCHGEGYVIVASGPNAPDACDVVCGCSVCPDCLGSGIDDVDVEQGADGLTVRDIDCGACRGKGVRS